ncbi:pentapeptide repeat-containing protein [Nonomuraea turcica]|uniref:pentapeptide repeat-containing protein n=1 Tax=Nonomuraea sp. G32 TaxID=3067274 RepID=UPI00273CB348|nr:pentapeptide repeat-containing protein [Nonomuraea sp. G32]MDP4510340.1 pentapeptide repeat-containing protein [Nonomuraea sp. G32]
MKPVSIVVLVLGLLSVAVLVLGPGAVWVLENVDGVTQDDGFAPAIAPSPTMPPATPSADPNELAAKDWASAVAGVRGNMLAIATGLAALVAVLYTARNANTARRTFQLGERGHVTDRYGKAVEQLGSTQAPVRLGGLYALDQLGQDNPSAALRQTIVDVICAYLRMPYTPPPDEAGPAAPAEPRIADGGVSAPLGRDPHEERQVRLTAQRILTAHLRYLDPPARRWWQPRSADLNARHWAGIRLDLTGATLLDFDLSVCRVGDAAFGRAAFHGDARFGETTFTGDAGFGGTTFTRGARFEGATFTRGAGFGGTTFTGYAAFREAAFHGDASFAKVTFTSHAEFFGATFTHLVAFEGATFTRGAGFAKATFTGNAGFEGAAFSGYAWFAEAIFTSHAGFAEATFTGKVGFGEATFTGNAGFGEATFTGGVWFNRATFNGNAEFDGAAFSGYAWFDGTTFNGNAEFDGATGLEVAVLGGVRVAPAAAGVRRVWPPTWQVEAGTDGWQTLRLVGPQAGGGAAEPGPEPAGEAEG